MTKKIGDGNQIPVNTSGEVSRRDVADPREKRVKSFLKTNNLKYHIIRQFLENKKLDDIRMMNSQLNSRD